MPASRAWQVVYFWRGERHVHLASFSCYRDAEALACEMRRDHWRAFAERVAS